MASRASRDDLRSCFDVDVCEFTVGVVRGVGPHREIDPGVFDARVATRGRSGTQRGGRRSVQTVAHEAMSALGGGGGC